MRRMSVTVGLLAVMLVAGVSPALGDSAASSNWAGYAIHRDGVVFRGVSAAWTEPGAVCLRGRRTYSAVWTGIGGFSVTSNALDQIGTEIDCGANGNVETSAWYELVPAPSEPVAMSVTPGDHMLAAVRLRGRRVVLSLADLTTHRFFTRGFHARSVDGTSAEWIVEAPSVCSGAEDCQTLPLADFGIVPFAAAYAQTATHSGPINDPAWTATSIRLRAARRHGVMVGQGHGAVAGATPSGFSAGGTSFSVNFSLLPLAAQTFTRIRRF